MELIKIIKNNKKDKDWDKYIGHLFYAEKHAPDSMDEDEDPWYWTVTIPGWDKTLRFEQDEVEVIEK